MSLLYVVWLFISIQVGSEKYQRNVPAIIVLSSFFSGFIIALPFLKRILGFNLNPVTIIKERWKLSESQAILIFFLFITAIAYTFFIPFVVSAGDEHSLLSAVQILIDNGIDYFFNIYVDIEWLGDRHPPLQALCIGFFAKFFDADLQLTSRILTSLLGLGTAGCTFLIAKLLFDTKTGLMAIILLYGIRLFFLHNIISGNDVFMTFFFTLTILISMVLIKSFPNKLELKTILLAFAAGIFLSLGILVKYTMLLILPLLLALFFFPLEFTTLREKFSFKIRHQYKTRAVYFFLVMFFFLPFTLSWLWFLFQSGYFQEQAVKFMNHAGASIEFNDGNLQIVENHFLDTFRLSLIKKSFFVLLPSGIGAYNLPLIGLSLLYLVKGEHSKKEKWSNRFILFWIGIVFISLILTLPVAKYFMPAFPPLAILMARGINWKFKSPYRIGVLAGILSFLSALIYL